MTGQAPYIATLQATKACSCGVVKNVQRNPSERAVGNMQSWKETARIFMGRYRKRSMQPRSGEERAKKKLERAEETSTYRVDDGLEVLDELSAALLEVITVVQSLA